MTRNEIARVQHHLRELFGNHQIAIDTPAKRGGPIEVRIGDAFIGVLHRDDEEGEVSYSLHIAVLAEELPPATIVPGAARGGVTRRF